MNLKFLCPKSFEGTGEIATQMASSLPNLVDNTEVVRTEALTGIFYTWDILPVVERVARPDWDHEIVLAVISGSVYFADMELTVAAATLDHLVRRGGSTRPYSLKPKIGGYYMPRNMPQAVRADTDYWAKVGVEEILHYFGIPEQHDVKCFYHPKSYEEARTPEDHRNDYCPKCREFMLHLRDPLDFEKLLAKVKDVYSIDFVHTANRDEQNMCVSPYAFSRTKRAVDIAFAGAGLVLTGILLPLVSMAIRLNSPGPVIYRHVRLGLGNNPFTLLKFRTMQVDAEAGTDIVGGQDDYPRLTAIGRMLRRLFIDELPQCWNILRGEMSVVGPRPYILEESEALRKTITWFDHRHCVRPGITGLAQVHYEHVNEGEQARRKLEHDLEYVRNCSLGMDLRILFRTALRILGMKGT